MYAVFNKIDVHDHYRQGILELERNWHTKCWWHRLFGTIIGMIVTDSYLAYRYDYLRRYRDDSGLLPFKSFCGRLTVQLAHNIFLSDSIDLRPREVDNTKVRYVNDSCINYSADKNTMYTLGEKRKSCY